MAPAQSSSGNPWFAVSMGLLGLIVGYGLATGMQGLPTGTAPSAKPTAAQPTQPTVKADPAGVDDDPLLGEEDAAVTLIEFTDYQCPFCGRFFSQTYPKIKSDYIDTGKVKYVVRDFPLSFHANAAEAAEAAECADDQDDFWAMHDLLFERQSAWSNAADPDETFTGYAKELGLNATTFSSCLSSDKHAEEIRKDFADGSAAGIQGTPGFWVVGKDGKGIQISGAQPFENFKRTIDALL